MKGNKEKLIPEISQSPIPKAETPVSNNGRYELEQVTDGAIVSVTPRDYERIYKHNPNFKLKKSQNV